MIVLMLQEGLAAEINRATKSQTGSVPISLMSQIIGFGNSERNQVLGSHDPNRKPGVRNGLLPLQNKSQQSPEQSKRFE